ncbi:MAG: hypothetical protein ACYCVH_16700, partial [Ignavibacteriaceae bacterium]
MENYFLKKTVLKFLLLTFFLSASYLLAQQSESRTLVNTSHLDHLYQEINVNGKEMGIIHIYANYPDYKYVDAPGEGIACVDDAARAA